MCCGESSARTGGKSRSDPPSRCAAGQATEARDPIDASNALNPAVNIRCKEGKMAGIQWEREFGAALEKAKQTGKPVFQDFWFDG